MVLFGIVLTIYECFIARALSPGELAEPGSQAASLPLFLSLRTPRKLSLEYK